MSEQANAGFHTSVAGYALTTSKEVQGEGAMLSDCSSLSFRVAGIQNIAVQVWKSVLEAFRKPSQKISKRVLQQQSGSEV